MRSSELELLCEGNLSEKRTDVTRMLFGQFYVRKAMRQPRTVQLIAVGCVNGRQD